MNKSNKNIFILAVAVLLEFCVLLGILWFQQNILMIFPLAVRAILTIVVQWVLLIVPIIFIQTSKEKLSDFGFSKKNIGKQIFTGILIAIMMSLVFTVLPILAGFKEMVGSTTYTQTWQYCYQFVYMILGVALVEEFFYRGFLFKRLMDIKSSKWFAIIVSSVIFGVSHIFNGNIIQVIATSILGVFFCVCRDKIKKCSTLSLIIAHGMHNALITLFVAIL